MVAHRRKTGKKRRKKRFDTRFLPSLSISSGLKSGHYPPSCLSNLEKASITSFASWGIGRRIGPLVYGVHLCFSSREEKSSWLMIIYLKGCWDLILGNRSWHAELYQSFLQACADWGQSSGLTYTNSNKVKHIIARRKACISAPGNLINLWERF